MPPRPELNRLRTIALEKVAEACERKKVAADAAQAADLAFREHVVHAAALGCSYDQIAEVAGVSRGRVGQIVKRGR